MVARHQHQGVTDRMEKMLGVGCPDQLDIDGPYHAMPGLGGERHQTALRGIIIQIEVHADVGGATGTAGGRSRPKCCARALSRARSASKRAWWWRAYAMAS